MGITVTYSQTLEQTVEEAAENVEKQLQSRTYIAANALRNSALSVLRGKGGGRSYRVPGTSRTYTASAPGEPPAMRTGLFRSSWQPSAHFASGSYTSRIETDVGYAGWLENGTPGGQMDPRPHHERILEHAKPEIIRIYSAPYD